MAFFEFLQDGDLVLDSLPNDVAATIEVRNRFMTNLAMGGQVGAEFVLADLQRWLPGQTVRVGFLDGNKDLHGEIEDATKEISDACNLTLDFGKDAQGNYRRWAETDTQFVAEIRVSFDKDGYFSLVGIDSINRNIGTPIGRVGGRPNQASLNLGGFAVQKPSTWRGTVRHEFLHALGFHHSHQNMRGPCEASFRWDDDPGYEPTQDPRGVFIEDQNGRRPGIYTYLAGFPNFWGRDQVDHNLKTEEDPSLVVGPFDRRSVMLYRFPALFYRTANSPCAPDGDGQSLSDLDKRGLQLLYPPTAAERDPIVASQRTLQRELEKLESTSSRGAESVPGAGGTAVLTAALEALRNRQKP
jgi:hypothetical protein